MFIVLQPPYHTSKTDLSVQRNCASGIVAMDVVSTPTIGFSLLHAFVIVRLGRRDIGRIHVTASPTAERIARQKSDAFSISFKTCPISVYQGPDPSNDTAPAPPSRLSPASMARVAEKLGMAAVRQ